MPSSMILRFRDLSGPIGSTVARHKQIIKEHGGVWWAWWNKPDETIPRDLFAIFKAHIRASGFLAVYLADSGRFLLFRARVTQIQEAPTEEPISSPDAGETPEYYRETPYKAWFRLECIEEVPNNEIESELRKWSYDEVEHFTDDPFMDLYSGKRIYNFQEVIHRRHRTIYFIQPYDDQHHPTHLVETVSKRPQNFVKEPIFCTSAFILHLSDLHFGPMHAFATTENEAGKRTLARLLIDDLRNEVKLGAPACVIISGDLTWQAKEDEFKQALEFIERLRSEFQLEVDNFVVIPGNHDFRWIDDPSLKPKGSEKPTVKFPAQEAKKNYRDFYTGLFGIQPDTYFSQGRRFLLGNYVTVDVIGVNSSELEQKHFAGYGYVGVKQLQAAMDQMQWSGSAARTMYRILALHHHLVGIVPEEDIDDYDRNYSITLDAGHIIYECQRRGVNLVVHGHQHLPFTGATVRSPSTGELRGSHSIIVERSGERRRQQGEDPFGRAWQLLCTLRV